MGTTTRISKRTSASRRGRRPTLAERADRHRLYEAAVQDPEADVDFLDGTFRRLRKRRPLVLREDFCGTAVLSAEWVASRKDRRAIGIDLDEPTLAWGLEHHIGALDPAARRRIRLIHADVCDAVGGKADIVCGLNFSYCVFKTRDALLEYFRAARSKLVRDGIFVLDVLGGTESMIEDETETELDEFVYRWEQVSFDPFSHHMSCAIHFDFPDGSSLSPAFTYDWRLWTMPELRELLEEAGFSRVRVLWERTDRSGEGTGSFYEPKSVENQEVWWTYLVAER